MKVYKWSFFLLKTVYKHHVYGGQIFGGLLVNVGSLGTWLSWMQYLSCARYSINVRRLHVLRLCIVQLIY